MRDPVQIRPATTSDAEKLLAYVTELRAERLPTIFRYPNSPTLDEELAFLRRFQVESAEYFVAEAHGAIVANLSISAHRHPQTRHNASLGMTVLAPYRGRGIGSSLLETAVSWCEDRRIRRLELEVLSNNPAAMRLYERHQFVHEGRRVGAIEVDGNYVDAILMARQIIPSGPGDG